MAQQHRHPYVTLRWVAGGWLTLSLFLCTVSPAGFASLAKSLDFRFQSAAFAILWLADLVLVTRFTIWLTSLVLLVPLAGLAPLAICWAFSEAHQTDRPFLPMLVAAPLLGASVLYYRYAWLWWLEHPGHKDPEPAA